MLINLSANLLIFSETHALPALVFFAQAAMRRSGLQAAIRASRPSDSGWAALRKCLFCFAKEALSASKRASFVKRNCLFRRVKRMLPHDWRAALEALATPFYGVKFCTKVWQVCSFKHIFIKNICILE